MDFFTGGAADLKLCRWFALGLMEELILRVRWLSRSTAMVWRGTVKMGLQV